MGEERQPIAQHPHLFHEQAHSKDLPKQPCVLGWAWELHSTSKYLNHVWNVDAWILKVTAIWSTWWGLPWHNYELMLWLEQWVTLAFEAFVWVWIPACKPHSSELSHFHFGKLDRADSKVCAASRNITNKEMKIIPFKKMNGRTNKNPHVFWARVSSF